MKRFPASTVPARLLELQRRRLSPGESASPLASPLASIWQDVMGAGPRGGPASAFPVAMAPEAARVAPRRLWRRTAPAPARDRLSAAVVGVALGATLVNTVLLPAPEPRRG